MTSRVTPPVTTRTATPADAARLASLAATAFSDTFGADNTSADLAMYMAKSFGEDIQRGELADSRHTVFFAERAGETVGYAMLRQGPPPADIQAAETIEIARLYAAKQWIGAGIGATLMQRCLDEAAALGLSTIWLAVWEHNARAIAFYQRWGFADAGTTTFMLGHDRQTDRVMSRRVAGVGADE